MTVALFLVLLLLLLLGLVGVLLDDVDVFRDEPNCK